MIDASGHYIGDMKPESTSDIKELIRQVIRDELTVSIENGFSDGGYDTIEVEIRLLDELISVSKIGL